MNFLNELCCPVCGSDFSLENKSLVCSCGHCFDMAKEGYVNLLTSSHKSGSLIGDNKSMALSRQNFLSKGFFSALSKFLCDYTQKREKRNPVVLDICCGEGYYSSELLQNTKCRLYGFDLSKEMIRLAAKRKTNASFFVANISKIPMKERSVDLAFEFFAPFHESEFSRVLKKDGVLLCAVPGENHLFELKEKIYKKAYKNDEQLPKTTLLTLRNTYKVQRKIELNSSEDIVNLFKMTPYFYHTSAEDLQKLYSLTHLETTTEFVISEYVKA